MFSDISEILCNHLRYEFKAARNELVVSAVMVNNTPALVSVILICVFGIGLNISGSNEPKNILRSDSGRVNEISTLCIVSNFNSAKIKELM